MSKKWPLIRQGFLFGTGFMLAAYLVMWFMDGLSSAIFMIFTLVMKGLGLAPAI